MNKAITTVVLTLSSLISPVLYGVIQETGGAVKSGYSYQKPGDLGLEVYNKSGQQIWYALKNGDDYSTLFTSRPVAGTAPAKQYSVDISKDTTLALWFSEPKGFEKKGLLSFNKQYLFNPEPDKLYTFTKGKTMYVTVDSSKSIRPETGPLKGILKKTESGLSLKNNIGSGDITSIK